MQKTVKQMIQNFTRQRTQRRRAYAAFTTLAILVSITTMYSLSQPASTMTGEPICGQEEHIHTDACYTEKLICGLEERTEAVEGAEEHVHDESCYEPHEVLVCTEEETEAHSHDESCYGLVCGETEYPAHTHGDDCYAVVTETCGQEEHEAHSHDESCYTTTRSLTCGEAESAGHTHDDSCYDENGALTCGQSESAGHTHSDSCYTESTALTCGQTESAGHTHDDHCFVERVELTCTAQEGPGHVHDDSCYGLACGQEETEGHTHTEECYETRDELVCAAGHVHTADCYEKVLTCQLPEHVHSSACYDQTQPEAPDEPEYICGLPAHAHDDACLDEEGNLICGLEEHEHTEDCLAPEETDLMIVLPEGAEVPEGYDAEYEFIDAENRFGVKVFAPEGALPEGAVLVAELLEEDSDAYLAAGEALEAMTVSDETSAEDEIQPEESDAAELEAEEPQTESAVEPEDEEPAEEKDGLPYDGFVALDIHFELDGEEVEPTAPVYVCINALGLLPEDADPESVAVQHHAEITESALFGLRKTTETVVETVADSTEETGPVEVTENAEDVTQDVAAAFEVKSFSIFTILWNKDGGTVTVHFVDKNGNPIQGKQETQVEKDEGKWVTLSDYNALVDSIADQYQYLYAMVDSVNGTIVTQVRYNESKSNSKNGWFYRTSNSGDGKKWTTDEKNIYLVYQSTAKQELQVHIVDTNGNPISGRAEMETLQIPQNTWVSLSQYAKTVDGYKYKKAKLGSAGDTIIGVKYDSAEQKWLYRTSDSDEEGISLDGNDIYMLYDTAGLHTVATVDSTAEGLHLYMFDYASAASVGGGSYGEGDTKSGLLTKTTSGSGEWYQKFPSTNIQGVTSQSLSTWFNPNNGTEANHLFLKSVYDSTGDFYYSAFENFASFDGASGDGGKSFTVYEELGTPSGGDAFYYKRGNFMPYNTLNPNSVRNQNLYSDTGEALSSSDPRYNEDLYGFNEGSNFYFGMYAYAEFYQPKDGEVTRPDGRKDKMIFEFTGDDDMWVYVDGVLVLDLGGIHDAQSGYINFTTGEIGWTDTKTSDTSAQWNYTTIKEQFTAAGQDNSVVWSSQRSNTFADGGLHNIQVFYMERGAGASNLKLRLNLPTIPEGSLLIRKNVENYYHPQMQDLKYTMQVKVGEEVYANQPYYIYPDNTKTFTTDSDGKFILKHDQTAVFENVKGGATVTVEETAVQPEPGASGRIDDLYDIKYTTADSNGTQTGTSAASATMPAAGSVSVTINNSAKFTSPLTVTKTFTGTTGNAAPEGFAADFQLYELDTDGTAWTAVGDPVPYSDFTDGSYTFMLEQDKTYAVTETVSAAGTTTGKIEYLNTTVTVTDEGTVTTAKPAGISGAVVLAQEDKGDAILFNNIYGVPIGDLSITKEVTVNGTKDEDNAGIFSFTLTASDTNLNGTYALAYDLALPGDSNLPTEITFTDGSATLQVQANRQVTIKGLPVGTTIRLEETGYDGYAPGWTGELFVDGKEATSANGATVTAQPINADNVIHVTCTNTTGAALPSTGGVGTQTFTFLGMMMMLSAGVLLMIQRRRREGI